jgi:hypothetical protein
MCCGSWQGRLKFGRRGLSLAHPASDRLIERRFAMMSPGDVRTFQQRNGNAVVIGLGLWAKKQGQWIQIHMTGPNDLHTTVTNNPESVRYHRTLYRDLRRTLVEQGCWPYGDEGAEVGAEPEEPIATSAPNGGEAPASSVTKDGGRPRFQPIKLRGDGPSASEILLADRQRF